METKKKNEKLATSGRVPGDDLISAESLEAEIQRSGRYEGKVQGADSGEGHKGLDPYSLNTKVEMGRPIKGIRKDCPTDGKESKLDYRFDLIPPESMFALAQVLKEGVDKGYKKDGWREVSCESHLNHALGHIYAHLMGDVGEDHLSHALTQLTMAYATRSPKSKVKRVYACHPCRGDVDGNRRKVDSIVRKFQWVYKGRILFIIPHFLFQHLSEEMDREMILGLCCEAVKGCDELWVLSPQITEGMRSEIETAFEAGIEVIAYEVLFPPR